MACNNNDFDVSKYSMYLRDMDISELELMHILQDVIDDIAVSTKIFKDIFVFEIENCDKVYDLKALYGLSQSLKQDVVEVVSTNYTTDELIKILQGVEYPSEDREPCEIGESVNSDEDIENDSLCLHTYMNIIDLMWYDERDKKNPIKSVIFRWLQQVGVDIYEIITDNLTRDTGLSEEEINLTNPVKVIGYASIIPNLHKLTADDERILRPALIAGLKYKVSDMYLNIANEQVSNLLYQRYYNAKKQLAFNFPQFVSNQKFKNADWNI